MRLPSSTSGLLVCSLAGAIATFAATAQAQNYGDRFYGGGPSYRTNYSAYPGSSPCFPHVWSGEREISSASTSTT